MMIFLSGPSGPLKGRVSVWDCEVVGWYPREGKSGARPLSPCPCVCPVMQVMQAIYAQDGLTGFYRGLGTGVSGRACESMLYWMLYERLKQHCGTHSETLSTPYFGAQVMSLSMVAKLVSSTLVYPYNVVRVHLWEVNPESGVHEYNHLWQTVRGIWRADGVRGFYSGLMPHLMRVIPSSGLTLIVYETLMRAFPDGTRTRTVLA